MFPIVSEAVDWVNVSIDVKGEYKFISGINWEGNEPETMLLGDYEIPTELYLKFMGYYLSEGCAGKYVRKGRKKATGRITIGQFTHKAEMWEILKEMPFKVWQVSNGFVLTDESVVDYCMQFGKSVEKFVPREIKELSSNLIKVFLDAYILGDGCVKKNKIGKHLSTNTSISTSSLKMRDDLTEIIQKAGYRPTVGLISKKGTPYKGTNYTSNFDVWRVSMCNKLHTYKGHTKEEEIEYHDKVYCVELEKNHTLWTMRNGKCWWSGNCQCTYELVFKNSSGEFVKTLNEFEENNDTSNNLDNSSDNSGDNSIGSNEQTTKELNGGKGSGNFGHVGRPGYVGGSGKTLGLAREKTFRKGDKVEITTVYGKEKGIFSGLETEEGVTRAVVQIDSGEIKKVPYDTLFIKMLENRDEGKPASKKERQTARQKQALASVFSQIETNNEGIKKLYEEHCSEEFAVALDNELKLAKADGLDISRVVLKEEKQKYGVATISSGRDGKLYFGIGFNRKIFGGGTKTENILAENKEKRWTTGTTVNEYIRHELGHLKMYQSLMKSQVDYREADSYAEAIIVKATGKKWREISSENIESRKEMSGYANKYGASEMVAEAWANPNYSNTTKAIARVLRTGGVTLEEAARQTTWDKDTPELIRRVYNALSKEIDICKGLTPSEEIDKKLNER